MPTPFTHLHLHSEYSFLDGFCRIDELAAHCKDTGVKAVALTDHGGLYGYFPFVQAMKKAGVKPILGCEIYLNPPSGFERSAARDPDENPDGGAGRPSLNHMTLLAKDAKGWQNLCKMISQAHTQDFYYKPVVTDENLQKNSEGIICLSGCMTGRLSRALLQGNPDAAMEQAKYFYDLFGKDNFFIEIHNHGMPEQKMLGEGLAKIAKHLNVPLCAANDVHYLRKEDAYTQDALVALNMGKQIDDKDRLSFLDVPELYFKNREEMAVMFTGYEEALDGPDMVQERCNFDLDLKSLHYPSMPGNTKEESAQELRTMIYSSLGKRIPDNDVTRDRIETELQVIEKSGYSDYFLIVADLRNHAVSRGIPVGPARGSVAGSLLAYGVGITDVDPLKHDLLFERFLNPERISPPDIDMDFCSERREEVLEYIRTKYGTEYVSKVVTFMTYAPKSAIKDACRGYGVPLNDAERISKTVDVFEGSAHDYFAENEKLQAERAKGGAIAKAIDLAERIIGLPSQPGVHAAAVVITPGPISNYVPLGRANDGFSVTMADMDGVTESGLLKLDILGLKTCTLVDRAAKMVQQNGIELNLATIADDDKKTGEVYSSGNSTHVFQVEDPAVQNFAKAMPVRSLQDFAMATSLCRPGPMKFIGEILDRVKGVKPVTPIHPFAPEIGKDTWGILIYQEQVMEATRKLAQFSMGGADLVRRAMGKKDEEKMAKVRAEFVEGCAKNNIPESEATPVFDVLADFAGYGFNKSHAVSYAQLSWQTAYLKAHHPSEFFAAALSCDRGKSDKLGSLLRDAQFNGVECSAPDVNISADDFYGDKGKILFGLSGIGGVAKKSVTTIIENRPYRDFFEFCAKTMTKGLKTSDIKALAGSGALDSFGERGNILNYMGTMDRAKLVKTAKRLYPDEIADGEDLFGGADDAKPDANKTHPVPHNDAFCLSDTDKYLLEKKLMGFSFSRNPATDYLGLRPIIKATPIAQLVPEARVKLLALLESKEAKTAKKTGNRYGIGVLSDETGHIRFSAFKPRNGPVVPGQDVSPEFDMLIPGHVYQIDGQVGHDGQLRIIKAAVAEQPIEPNRFSILLDHAKMSEDTLEKIREATSHVGGVPFSLAFFKNAAAEDGKKEWSLVRPNPQTFSLQRDYEVFREIMSLPGVSDIAGKIGDDSESKRPPSVSGSPR